MCVGGWVFLYYDNETLRVGGWMGVFASVTMKCCVCVGGLHDHNEVVRVCVRVGVFVQSQ